MGSSLLPRPHERACACPRDVHSVPTEGADGAGGGDVSELVGLSKRLPVLTLPTHTMRWCMHLPRPAGGAGPAEPAQKLFVRRSLGMEIGVVWSGNVYTLYALSLIHI